MKLRIGHLYPEVLNLYGDRGNILCLKNRLIWRGIEAEVVPIRVGERISLADIDLFFMGGGQDFDEAVLLEDLRAGRGAEIRAAIEDGKTLLAICGGYQILGQSYTTCEGVRHEFLGALDLETRGSRQRMIDDYAFKLSPELRGSVVVGFENHSGKTYLGPGVQPLGRVLKGGGNNGEDGSEGAHYKNVFGTYAHGPVLPKNPALADLILATAICHKTGADPALEPLDDTAEERARQSMLRRILGDSLTPREQA